MEKSKEQEIFKDNDGTLKCTRVYNTNVCIMNEIIVKGDLEIIVMCIIKNLEDDDETTILIELYNNNVPEDILQNNYLSFSCRYDELESYQFDGRLQEEISATLSMADKYRL